MHPNDWRRIERVLDRALTSDSSAWPALLDDNFGGEPELRAEAAALLAQHSAAREFLVSPPSAALSALVAEKMENDPTAPP